jgi:DNA-binding YbaB/EbfC family protein
MLDMMKMMGKVKELQEKMKEAQESLALITAEGESGAGMVTAKVNGKKQVLSVNIDPSLLTESDKDMVQDLVVAAINKALDEVDFKAKDHIKQNTEGMMPNIPGFDLNNLV